MSGSVRCSGGMGLTRESLVNRFNQREEDFPDLQSYNDYLETYEDLSALLPPPIHYPR